MTKMSEGRKVKKGKVEAEKVYPRRNLNKSELKELLEMTRLVNNRMWETMLVAGNTALIPDGKALAEQMEALSKVLLNAKNNWMSQTLRLCGVPTGQSVNVNSETGEVVDAPAEEKEEKEEIKIEDSKVEVVKKKKK